MAVSRLLIVINMVDNLVKESQGATIALIGDAAHTVSSYWFKLYSL